MKATDHRLFQLNVFDWREFRKGKKLDEAWDAIRRTIDWSDPETQRKSGRIRFVAERKLNDHWKTFKAKLRKVWYTPNVGTEERFKCKDGRVNKEQWVALVNHWEDEKEQWRSIVNKQSRAKRRMMHTTGTKTFAEIRNRYVEKKNGGVNPDRCKMFELTHVHDNENPDEPNSKQAIALMKDKIDKMKTTKRASQLPEALNDFEINEVYASVLGKETRGGVRGFGIGVRPEQVPGVLVQKRGVHLEVQAMREQHEAEIETIRKESQEKEDKLREELNKQTLATKDKFKNMEIAMKKQEALMALLLGAYESTDMLGAALRMKGASFQPSMSHIQSSYEENLDDVYIPHCSEELRQQVTRN
ncbi:uncharacterized protein LOC112181396 [Rosa chinensis]|uniref:uncharacterized protein LOC112181396 n=1 Tax=Rosa chinensis TaxID=74649 RepID=UPI000D08FAB0|nr:uncharacterized protein LOC112181396 [Rosa chinensis]XP_040368610.1 uncharacterized protein LOC112181396 [Rosa chinensis]